MTSSPLIRAVIFDLDGTLIDTAPHIAATFNIIWADMGRTPLTVAYVEQYIGKSSRWLIEEIFTDQGIPYDSTLIDAKLADYMVHYTAQSQQKTNFFPNVQQDLQDLIQAGLKLGLCTNKPHHLTEMVLTAQSMGDYFQAFLGPDRVANNKPHGDHLRAVMNAMGVTAQETVFVGDTEIDRQCAHNAGVRFFLVPWGGGKTLEAKTDTKLTSIGNVLDYCTTVCL